MDQEIIKLNTAIAQHKQNDIEVKESQNQVLIRLEKAYSHLCSLHEQTLQLLNNILKTKKEEPKETV